MPCRLPSFSPRGLHPPETTEAFVTLQATGRPSIYLSPSVPPSLLAISFYAGIATHCVCILPLAFTSGTSFPQSDLLCPFTLLKTFCSLNADKLEFYTQSKDQGLNEHSSQTPLMQSVLCSWAHSPSVAAENAARKHVVSWKMELKVVHR